MVPCERPVRGVWSRPACYESSRQQTPPPLTGQAWKKTEKRDMEKKEMDVEKRGRVVLVSGQLDDGKIAEIVNNGYRVEKRVWGGYIVSDPAMGFTWEIEDMVFDLKRTLGML